MTCARGTACGTSTRCPRLGVELATTARLGAPVAAEQAISEGPHAAAAASRRNLQHDQDHHTGAAVNITVTVLRRLALSDPGEEGIHVQMQNLRDTVINPGDGAAREGNRWQRQRIPAATTAVVR